MKPTKSERELYCFLLAIEELIEKLNPDEKNKKLNKVYQFVHSFNKKHKCFFAHQDWRKDFKDFFGGL